MLARAFLAEHEQTPLRVNARPLVVATIESAIATPWMILSSFAVLVFGDNAQVEHEPHDRS